MSRSDDPDAAPGYGRGPDVVVGVGASAGGIKAMQGLFSRASAGDGPAYVVILHLSPEHESRLAEVLQGSTSLPVTRVTEAVRIERDHIYVISPKTSLRMEDDTLVVTPTAGTEERRAPVDIFFRTLAESHGSRAVAVVLSGTGPNGSNGIKRIKEHGGLVIAQDPGEAEHEDMPRNSIRTGHVDYVLPIAEIAARILSYQKTRRHITPIVRPEREVIGDTLQDVLALVRQRTGQDFSHYKIATVLRRIERRLALHDLADLPAYGRFIREHPDEAQALLGELLISVTQFFRDAPAFAALERQVIPRLVQGRHSHEHVRVWVAGCATGEEAYSIAMLLAEAAARLPVEPTIQVFASDLDQTSIGEAREGRYSEADVVDVSPERLRRFFNRDGDHYRVRRDLRETVLFAHHNVLKDPPFSHLDLITCRNLLIYLNSSAQARLMETFHFALRPGGWLFLGSSESTEGGGDLYTPLDKTAHIYESSTVASRSLPLVPDLATIGDRVAPELPAAVLPRATERITAGDLHMQMLEEYAPPSIVVTEDHQIVHVSPRAAQYLKVASGEPSRELLKLVQPELRAELRAALYQAVRDRTSVSVAGVPLTLEGAERTVDLIVRPVLRSSEPARGFVLVLFREPDPAAADEAGMVVRYAAGAIRPEAPEVQEELSDLRLQLRSTIDQYETQTEELKASNEELQAVNEELRSAAEELETSKEELQSVNEELTTVNQELKIKIEELGLANNDFQNLINSTDIGTVFLDRGLQVKLSTPRARDVFNLLPLDIGRPLSDITHNLLYEGLQTDALTVLRTLQTVEREVQTRDGAWFLVRVLPYRTTDERIEGVVITFQDISPRRRAESEVRASEERLRLLIDSVKDYAIFTVTPDGVIDTWNKGAERMFGYPAAEIVGQPFARIFTPEDREAGAPERELATARADGRAEDERWHVRKDQTRIYCSGVTTLLGESKTRGFAKIARDLSERRESAMAITQAHEQLEDRVRVRTRELEVEVTERGAAEHRITTLVRQLVTAQEDERSRVARDIHDHVGQQLTALRLSLERHERALAEGSRGHLDDARAIVQTMDHELEFLAWQLRPAALDDLGLAVALAKFLETWAAHHDIATELRTSGIDGRRLPSAAETTCYRIAQEAVNNVAKHAHASRVDVILEWRDGEARLLVEDDGVGFEAGEHGRDGKGFGLVGMRERAALVGGTLQVESTPGKGTTVFLRVPVAAASGDA